MRTSAFAQHGIKKLKREAEEAWPAFLMAVAREGSEATEIARKAVEGRFGIPVITLKSAVQLNQVVVEMIEGNIALSEEGIDS